MVPLTLASEMKKLAPMHRKFLDVRGESVQENNPMLARDRARSQVLTGGVLNATSRLRRNHA